MTDDILVEYENRTAVVTMSRPAKRNALPPKLSARLLEVFFELDADDDVRVVVLTGAGDKAFTAGHDLQATEEDDDLGSLYGEPNIREFLAPRLITKPVISAVNGAAYAGGFCLAIASDVRIAAENATFAAPGVRLGIVPIGGQLSMLPRVIPPAVAAEMVMTGTPLTAQRAHQVGFVSEVLPGDQLMERARGLAASIAAMSPGAVRSAKRIMQTTLMEGFKAAEAMEFWRALIAGTGPDVREGLAAFRERRAPEFTEPA